MGFLPRRGWTSFFPRLSHGKKVPKKLTRTTTDDTQTAINRVVHEAVARSSSSGSKGYAARATMGAAEKEDLLANGGWFTS